ncbi:WecB/TagA/CpsF family glycosyltransferase [Curtobacterium flaccumfaciens]|uniref:WecB/TagA/CpsF family glycosyltransferase n=1 Tax=Curtobacterium flaccumfaciens TaxID=2035 RepID=UPI0039965E0E
MLTFAEFERTEIAGVPIIVATRDEAIEQIAAVAKSGGAGDVHLANSYVISLTAQDEDYHRLIASGAAVYPDGKPLTWVSRVLPGRALSQVRGPSLFPDMMDRGRSRGLRHFLLGNTDEVLASLRAELERRYPGVSIVGTHRSYFRPLTDDELAAQDAEIVAADPDIIWVGLGTPLQDVETRRIAEHLGKVAIGVGVAFDFIAGTKPVAPEWMTRVGLEWVFRLASEPRRLWKRYLIGNFVFLRAALRRRR